MHINNELLSKTPSKSTIINASKVLPKLDYECNDLSDTIIIDNAMQPDYKSIDTPSKLSKQEETNLSALKQEFIMTVFKNLVTTDEGKSIISKYSSTGKAQELWKKIEAHKQHQLSFSQDSSNSPNAAPDWC